MLTATQTSELNGLLALESVTPEQQLRIDELVALQNNSHSDNTPAKSDRQGYAWYNGYTASETKDGVKLLMTSFDLSDDKSNPNIKCGVAEDSFLAGTLKSLSVGDPIFIKLRFKKEGESYQDKDGNVRTYRTTGFMITDINKASREVVSAQFNDSLKNKIAMAKEYGATREEVLALIAASV